MRLLLVAHTPPPHHGQSFIVEQLLKGFESDQGRAIQIVHVNARFSKGADDIGRSGIRKIALLVLYAAEIVWYIISHRPQLIYYIPAPGKRVAVYRDWVLLGVARLLGIKSVLHWLAGGLDHWVSGIANRVEKAISMRVYSKATLSIVPVNSERQTAAYFQPADIKVIATGIPDPCADFRNSVLPARCSRLEKRSNAYGLPEIVEFRAIFMAHCTADKGLFDAMEAVAMANRRLRESNASVFVTLDVFGQFMTPEEKGMYTRLSSKLNGELSGAAAGGRQCIQHLGFVAGVDKDRVFRNADVLCFPTYYGAEVIPTVVIDALAYGLPVISTDWRGVPELLPAQGLAVCSIRSPSEVSRLLLQAISYGEFGIYREMFVRNFEVGRFISSMRAALLLAAATSPSREDTSE
jgi:glycosyltransferase involved in cell wall biosynthesis